MRQYVIRRLLWGLTAVFGVATLVFLLIRVIPGDVAALALGDDAPPEAIAALREELGLNKPIYEQYVSWMVGLAQGDLGLSLRKREPVVQQLADRWPVTFELALISLVVAVAIGLPIGVLAAVKQDKPFDHVVRVLAILGIGIPEFWLGTMSIVFLALWFHYSPPLGFTEITVDPLRNIQQFMLPALVLATHQLGGIARLSRATMLEVIRQDYVRTARAKGLLEGRVIVQHALKNAMIPVITILGLQLGRLLGGTVIIENIFSLPGVGRLTAEAIFQRDYSQLQANILFFAFFFVLLNIFVDVMYGVMDPRIRFK